MNIEGINILRFILHKSKDEQGNILPSDKQAGVKAFKHFNELDKSLCDDVFQVSFLGPVLAVLGTYYKGYGTLPSKELYNELKARQNDYIEFLNTSTKDESDALELFEIKIFKPLEDVEFALDRTRQFILRNYHIQSQTEQAELALSDIEDMEELFREYTDKRLKFLTALNNDLKGHEGEGAFTYEVQESVDQFKELDALPTQFRTINLYHRGITVLASKSKAFKSGISQNVAIHLSRKANCDVLYIDLENGLTKMLRRTYQNITKAEKEWIYSDTYVHKSMMKLREYSPKQTYLDGAKVFRVESWSEGEEEEKKYFTEVNVYSCISNDPEPFWNIAKNLPQYDWELVEDFELPNRLYEPFTEVLNKKIKGCKDCGELRYEFMAGACPNDIIQVIETLKTKSDFYSGKRKKVLIIDWGQLLKSNNKRDTMWDASKNNYQALSELAKVEGLYIFMIEAPKNSDEADAKDFDVAKLKFRGNTQINYDAVSIVLSAGTPEEKKAGVRRLVLAEDRDNDSGSHVVEYLRTEPQIMTAYPILRTDHEDICPDFWNGSSTDHKEERKVTNMDKFKDLIND